VRLGRDWVHFAVVVVAVFPCIGYSVGKDVGWVPALTNVSRADSKNVPGHPKFLAHPAFRDTMVYYGILSKGCQRCRQRKVKVIFCISPSRSCPRLINPEPVRRAEAGLSEVRKTKGNLPRLS
jgi:hypothetical protein